MSEDISKTTIIILLVLTVVISVIGTWTVLDSLGNMDQQVKELQADGGESNIQLSITPSRTTPGREVDRSRGAVTLSIV